MQKMQCFFFYRVYFARLWSKLGIFAAVMLNNENKGWRVMTFWNFLRIKQEQYGAIKLIIVFMQVGLQKLKIHALFCKTYWLPVLRGTCWMFVTTNSEWK